MDIQTKAIIFSLITLIGWGLENALSKKYSRKLSPSKLIIFRNSTTVGITFIALTIFWHTITLNTLYVIIGFILSILGYFGYFFFLKALEKGNLGIISPISSSRIIISAVIGTTFLNDKLSTIQWILILIIFLGVVLTSLDLKNIKKSNLFSVKSGIPYALLNALIWGIVFPFYSIPSAILGSFLFSFILEITGLVISVIQTINNKKRILLTKKEFKENFLGLFLIGISGGLGGVFMNLGFATGKVSIVSAIISAVPIITITYGKFVYKEQLTKTQIFAVALIVSSIVLLTYL